MASYAGGVYGVIATPQITTGNPATVNDLTAQNPIGGTIMYNGAEYRYVKHSTGTGGIAAVAGAPAYAVSLTPAAGATSVPVFTVTPDASDTVLGKMAVGVYLNVPTNAYFCWIQIGGKATIAISTGIEGDVAVGGTTDQAFEKIAEGSNLTQIPMAKVQANISTTLSSAWLMNMDF